MEFLVVHEKFLILSHREKINFYSILNSFSSPTMLVMHIKDKIIQINQYFYQLSDIFYNVCSKGSLISNAIIHILHLHKVSLCLKRAKLTQDTYKGVERWSLLSRPVKILASGKLPMIQLPMLQLAVSHLPQCFLQPEEQFRLQVLLLY